jgi:uncharacterized repeat protein (TIGR02543 family)
MKNGKRKINRTEEKKGRNEMKHSTMKIMSLILAVCMIMSLMPMSVLASDGDNHTVTLNLTNITAAPADSPASVASGSSYTTTLTAGSGYTLPSSVTAGTETLNAVETAPATGDYYLTSGVVYLDSVTADTTITAAGVSAGWSWKVKVCGTDITAGGYYTASGSTITAASETPSDNFVRWDSALNTLYISNFNVASYSGTAINIAPSSGSDNAADQKPVNIVLTGSSTIVCSGTGLWIDPGDTHSLSTATISGGSLSLTGEIGASIWGNLAVTGDGTAVTFKEKEGSSGSNSYQALVMTGDLTVADTAVLNAIGVKHCGFGLHSDADLDIGKDAQFNVKSGTGDGYAAMYAQYPLTGVFFKYYDADGVQLGEDGNFNTSGGIYNSGNDKSSCYPSHTSGGGIATNIRLSNLKTDTTYSGGSHSVSTTYYASTLPAFNVTLVPTSFYADAGSTMTYNINLTQTAYSPTNGNIQQIDFGIGYDSNLTVSAAAASSTYDGLTIADESANHKLTLSQTDTGKNFAVGMGNTVTLGTVTFNMPAYDETLYPQGVYLLGDFSIETGATPGGANAKAGKIISVGSEQQGIVPSISQVKSADYGKNVAAVHAMLTIPSVPGVTVTAVKTRNGSENLSFTPGVPFQVSVADRPYYTITLSTGYKASGFLYYKYSDGNPIGATTQRAMGYFRDGETTANFSTDSVLAGNAVLDLTSFVSAQDYTITYDLDGGKAADGTAAVTGDSYLKYTTNSTSYTFPAAPTRTGYTFQGWYVTTGSATGSGFTASQTTGHTATYDESWYNEYEDTFSGLYAAGSSVVLSSSTGDIAVKAAWNINHYKNTYNGNGGKIVQGTPYPTFSPSYGEEVVITITPPAGKRLSDVKVTNTETSAEITNRATYSEVGTKSDDLSEEEFKSWFAQQQYIYDLGEDEPWNGGFIEMKQPDYAFTVNPTYSDCDYPVTYKANGSDFDTGNTYKYNTSSTSFSFTTAVPTRAGYTFTGWKVADPGQYGYQPGTVKDGSNNYFKVGNEYSADTNGKVAAITLTQAYGPVVLEAQWQGNEQTNTYTNVTKTSPADPVRTGDTVTVTVPAKTGYTPAGITVTPDAGTITDNGNGSYSFTQPNGGVVVTPKYTANSYTVTLNANGGANGTASIDATYDSASVGTITNPARTGYTFDGWYTASDNDGILVIKSDGTFAAVTAGYTGTENDTTVWKLTKATTLYAHWTGAVQNNTALPSGVTSDNYTGAKTGDTVTITVTPNGGYYLSGLKIAKNDNSGGVTPDTEIDYTQSQGSSQTVTFTQPACGVTVTPTYAARDYTLTFKYNDNGKTADTTTTYKTTDGTVALTAPERAGYEFAGWKVTTAASAGAFSRTETVLTNSSVSLGTAGSSYGDATLTAQWTGLEYTITLSAPDAKDNPYTSQIHVYSGQEITAVSYLPTRTGYALEGWYTTADASGVKVLNANATCVANVAGYTTSDGKWDHADDVTLYAHWTGNKHTITLTGKNNGTDIGTLTGNTVLAVTYGQSGFTGDLPTASANSGYVIEAGRYIAWTYDTELGYPKTVNVIKDGQLLASVGVTSSGYGNQVTNYTDADGKWIYDGDVTLDLYGYPETYSGGVNANGGTFTTGNTYLNNVAVYSGTPVAGIHFDSGSLSFSTTINVTGPDQILNSPTKTGYTLEGWYLDSGLTNKIADGNGEYVANETYTKLRVVEETNIYIWSKDMGENGADSGLTFYAKWTPAQHTANTLNDSVTTEPASPKTGEDVTVTVPAKTGYTISGLTVTDANSATVAVTKVSETTYKFAQPETDVTITPVYTPINYTLTFAPNGGDSVDSVTYNTDMTSVTLPTPTRTGYDFAGWKVTAAAAAGAFSTVNAAVTSPVSLGDKGSSYGDATLTAQWTGVHQTNAAAPSSVVATDTTDNTQAYPSIPTGDTVSLAITAPAGQYLSGLTIQKTGDSSTTVEYSGTIDTEGKPTDAQTFTYVQPGYGVTIVPVFSGRTYTITMKVTGKYNYTGSDTFTVTYGSKLIIGGPGSISTDGTGYYDEYPGILTVNGNNTNEDVVIKYTTSSGINSYELAAESPEYDASPYVSKDGVWRYAGDVSVAPITAAETYTAKFVANGGTAIADTSFEYGRLFAPTKTLSTRAGYTIEGWYLDAGLTAKVSNGSNNSEYPSIHWLSNVSYNGDTYTTVADKYGNSLWKKDLGENNAATITFYAKWTPVAQKNAALPDGVTAVDTTDGSKTYPNIPTEDTVTVTVPDKTGYTPSGLTLTLADTSLTVPTVTDAGDSDVHTWRFVQPGCSVTVTPTYAANSYTVALNGNNGTGNSESLSITYDSDAVGTITNPTRTGYTFAGWYDAATDGNKVIDANGALAGVVTGYTGTENSKTVWKVASNDKTLYAHWTANTYNVTLTAADATTAGDGSFTATFGSAVPAFKAPLRAGYTLEGWYSGKTKVLNGTGEAVKNVSGFTDENGSWTAAGNQTLTAGWTANTQTVTLPKDGTVSSSPAVTDGTVTLTVTPPTGQKIKTLTVAPTSGGSDLTLTPANYKDDDSQQSFTYTQPADAVTVAVEYEYIAYAVTFNDNNATKQHAGGANTYTYADMSLALPTTAPERIGYVFDGWSISRPEGAKGSVNGGSADVAKDAASIDLANATGIITMTAKWVATNNVITVNAVNTNTGDTANHAEFGMVSGIKADTEAGKYIVTAEAPAVFTVTPNTGYNVTSVVWTPAEGSGTPLTKDANGKYTLTASQTAYAGTLTYTTELAVGTLFTVTAQIDQVQGASDTFHHFSVYSGNKTLVKIHVNSSIASSVAGLAIEGTTVYNAGTHYTGYEYVALVDLSGADQTQAGLEAYVKAHMTISAAANKTLDFTTYDANGKNGFYSDDISVAYDYTSKVNLNNWTPTDEMLIICDLDANGQVVDADVAAFVHAFTGK